MKPQERIDAIRRSKCEPSMRLLLVMIASYMADERLTAWPKEETLAEDTGLSCSTVRALLKEAEEAGLVRRWNGEHRAKDVAIEWSALAAFAGKATARGGARGPNIGGKAPNTGTQPPNTGAQFTADNRHPNRRSSAPQPPNTGGLTAEHRPRTDQEPTNEPTREPLRAHARATPSATDAPPPEWTLPTGDQDLLAYLGPGFTSHAIALVREHIRSRDELLARSVHQLRYTRGIGEQRADTLRKRVEELGHKLAPDKPDGRRQSAPSDPAGIDYRGLLDGRQP